MVDITYLNLSLTDPTLEDEAILTIVTQGEREKFPPVLGNYIIILKNIRVGSYFKRFRLTGDEDTHFAVFSINSLKEVPPYDDGCILKYEDHLVVKAVAGWIRGNGYGLGPEQPTQVISNLLQSSKFFFHLT
jgi:hypothetical protein